METRDGRIDNGTQSGRTFANEIHENELPDLNRVNPPGIDRGQHYNEVNKLPANTNNDRTMDSLKHTFVVVWQMRG